MEGKLTIVSSAKQMAAALVAAGLTATPLPVSHSVAIGDLTIERAVRESSFYGCNHDISTDRFSKEREWCAVCAAWRTVR